MPLPNWVAEVISPITGLIDNLTFSGEEKAKAKLAVLNLQVDLATKALDYEARLIEAQSKIITAEAQGESWLQRNWRPLTMMVFTTIVAWNYILAPSIAYLFSAFGWTSPPPPLAIADGMWDLLKLGIGGYVAGRSLEKIAGSVSDAFAAKSAQ